jgi:hypothetical protein
VVLGLAFLISLAISFIVNTFFLEGLTNILQNQEVLQNQLLAVAMLFVHNVLVVSLIILGMTFYVNLVLLNFFKREKYAHIVLEHSRTFALVFAVVVIFLSILRGSSLFGGLIIEKLPLILLISSPMGIVEGYGIYLTIKKTLSRSMSTKDLIYIYGIFLIAAMIEVGFINLLIWVSGK